METHFIAFRPAAQSARDSADLGPGPLIIPSGDNNVYGVDLLTAKVLWSFPSGAPVAQEPLVADQDVYSINTAGNMTSLDPASGQSRVDGSNARRSSCRNQRAQALSSQLQSRPVHDGSKDGPDVGRPGETHIRAGLNLRDYDLDIVNRFNDRIYFATSSGMIVCMRRRAKFNRVCSRTPRPIPSDTCRRKGSSPRPRLFRQRSLEVEPKNEPGAPGADDAAADAPKGKGTGRRTQVTYSRQRPPSLPTLSRRERKGRPKAR